MSRILLAAALVLGATSFVSDAHAGDRREVVKAADTDNNVRLDGKEAKTLKKEHPKMYDNLMSFCEAASEHPKKNGVDLPENPTKDQLECKKKHISKPFLLAWIAEQEATEAPAQQAPVDDGRSPSGGRE